MKQNCEREDNMQQRESAHQSNSGFSILSEKTERKTSRNAHMTPDSVRIAFLGIINESMGSTHDKVDRQVVGCIAAT